MSKLGRSLVTAAAMLGVGTTLAACSGGGSEAASVIENQTAGRGIAVGEPNGGVPVVSEHIKMAQEASTCCGAAPATAPTIRMTPC